MRSTIQAAYNLAVAGDTVWVRGSATKYAEIITTAAAGASGNPIILEVYPPDITTTNIYDPAHWPVLITRWDQASGAATNHHYQYVSGFKIEGPYGASTDSGLTIRSSFNTFSNLWIHKGLMGQTYINFVSQLSPNNNIGSGSNLVTHCLLWPGTNYVGIHTGTNDTTGFVVDTNLVMIPNSIKDAQVYNWNDGGAFATILSNTVDTIYHGSFSSGITNEWTNGQRFMAGWGPEVGISFTGGGNTIRSCVITNFADVERMFNAFHSPNTTLENNLLINTKASFAENGNHVDIIQILDEVTATNIFATNWVLQSNRFINNDCQFSNIEMDPPYCINWIFRGNLIDGINTQMGPKVQGSKYYNNTYVNIGNDFVTGFVPGGGSRVWNNIFIGEHAGMTNLCRFFPVAVACSSTTAEIDADWDVNNNFYASWTNLYPAWAMNYLTNCTSSTNLCDTAPVTGVDPLFTDPYNADTYLRSYVPLIGSSLIGAGINLAAEWSGATDLNGVLFGQSGSWPIGAFEFNGAVVSSGVATFPPRRPRRLF